MGIYMKPPKHIPSELVNRAKNIKWTDELLTMAKVNLIISIDDQQYKLANRGYDDYTNSNVRDKAKAFVDMYHDLGGK